MRDAGQLTDDTLVATVMSNLGLKIAMADAGIRLLETRVGDRYVLEELRAKGLALGGEQSGHIVMPAFATTGDGVLTALHLMGRMTGTGRSLADLASVVHRLPQVLINVPGGDRAAGAKAGLSVKPGTPIEPYLEILREFDTLLVMSVEPGFGGQKFIAEVLPKVGTVRRLVDAGELTILIEIDGGINTDTIEAAAEAGVDCFVAGSAVYSAEDPAAAVQSLRSQAASASKHLVL